MKILFTFFGGNGHFVPLIPVARAAQARGHQVAFSCEAPIVARVRAAGFDVLNQESVTWEPSKRPLLPVDMVREYQGFRDHFVGRGARNRAPLTERFCQEWQPDILVCEESDLGSMVAAEKLGLPYGTLLVMAAGSFITAPNISEVLDDVRAEHGLPADPTVEMMRRYLVLSPFPPRFRDPLFPLPPTGFSFRPPLRQAEQPPPWLSKRPDRPLVYFTLGTIFNLESGDLFSRVLAGLRELDVDVIVTVGTYIDPAELGPQPDHIQLKRYVPQNQILPYCDLVISHGGSGSVAGTLAYGLPSVLIPMGADQPLNGQRCQQLGLAEILDPITATPIQIREAVAQVLEDATYQQAARQLMNEFAQLPDTAAAVDLLERLAAEKEPLIVN